MARKKISEFAAKKILFQFLEKEYSGISIDANDEYFHDLLSKMQDGKKYVLKVDQGIKQRKKKGLISFGVTKQNIDAEINSLKEKGFNYFILEEFIEHEGFGEYYLAIERVREGKRIHYSTQGGIDIESNKDSIVSAILTDYNHFKDIASVLNLPVEVLDSIITAFDNYYFSFLEINPLVVKDNNFYLLDTAVEVDSEAAFFVDGAWSKNDFREARKEKTEEEKKVEELKETTPAALSFQILNPDGSIFVLLSGGGASLVTADEIYQKGKGKELANYGEYSGSPTEEETYLYVRQVLSALFKSKASKKAIIVAGGVANFTDVRITFKGIISAMNEVKDDLLRHNVKVFVRRGGPHQEEGLAMMKKFLEESNLLGEIHGPELVLTDIVSPALAHVD